MIVATGLLRPQRFTDVTPTRKAREVRLMLRQEQKIVTGDEFLANSTDVNNVKNRTVGILGAGGNSGDVVNGALNLGAKQVVVWGVVDEGLSKTTSFSAIQTAHKDKICRVTGDVTEITYNSSQIQVSARTRGKNTPATTCDESTTQAPTPDLLVESLGRYEGDPPPEVVKAARDRRITYKPLLNEGGALIAVQVFIDNGGKNATADADMYLIGAAATWIPPSVEISSEDQTKYERGLKTTGQLVNSGFEHPENPYAGFAVAAFMGSELGRLLSHKTQTPCPELERP